MKLILFFLGIVAPGLSRAQADGLGMTYDQIVEAGSGNGDTSREILSNLLSDFAENPFAAVGEPDTLLGNLFFLFNSGIFIVGTALLSYFILASVAQTAHEGEVLGKRINGLWVPIRVSLGVFGMLPVFGGFSLAQAIVMWFVILGIGLANLMTTAAISNTEAMNALIPPPGISTPAPQTSFSETLVRNMFNLNVCAAAARRHHEELTWSLSRAPEVRMREVSDGHLIDVKNTSYGIDCGSVLLQKGELRENGVFEIGYRSAAVNYDSINTIALSSYAEKLRQLDLIQREMMQEATAFVDAYWEGKDAAASGYRLDTSIFAQLAQEANEAVGESVQAAVNNTNEAGDSKASALTEAAAQAIKQGGWMSLGSWHSTYAEVQAALQTAAYHGQLKESPMNISPDNRNSGVTQMTSISIQLAGQPALAAGDASGEFKTDNSPGRWLTSWLLSRADGTAGTGMTNPVTLSKTAGDLMITGAIGVYAASTVLETLPIGGKVLDWVSSGVSSAPGVGLFGGMVGAILSDVGTLLPIISILLLVVGATLSIYVPMIPFLTWFAALIGYFVSVIEGLVAAQVWAFGHLSMDGEGMGQKTEKGYAYLLNMLLRPPLMVLGFFFASALVILMGSFLIDGVRTLVENVQGNSVTGLISILGFLVIFAILLITLVSSCFDMIFAVPDRVISWFGGGMEFVAGRDMSSKIEGQATAASRWAGGAAGALHQGRSALQAARLRGKMSRTQGD